jgi:hypothetical protein
MANLATSNSSAHLLALPRLGKPRRLAAPSAPAGRQFIDYSRLRCEASAGEGELIDDSGDVL